MGIFTRAIWAAFGVLQFVLAVPVVSESPVIAVAFAVGGALLLFAAWRRTTPALVIGTACALLGPLLVGLTGVEDFQLVHHVVRWALVAIMALLWFRFVQRASAPATG